MTTRSILSPDDVVDLPRPSGVRGHELVHGRAVPLPALSEESAKLRAQLVQGLAYEAGGRSNGSIISDAGFVLGLPCEPERMRIADIAYLPRAKVDTLVEPYRAFRCAPDIVILMKPCDDDRVTDFLEAGAAFVWTIDLEKGWAAIHRFDDEGDGPGFTAEAQNALS